MILQTPSTYLKNKEARTYTLTRIRCGNIYYVVNGEEIPIQDFLKQYPLGEKIRQETIASQKGTTPDKRYVH